MTPQRQQFHSAMIGCTISCDSTLTWWPRFHCLPPSISCLPSQLLRMVDGQLWQWIQLALYSIICFRFNVVWSVVFQNLAGHCFQNDFLCPWTASCCWQTSLRLEKDSSSWIVIFWLQPTVFVTSNSIAASSLRWSLAHCPTFCFCCTFFQNVFLTTLKRDNHAKDFLHWFQVFRSKETLEVIKQSGNFLSVFSCFQF